MIHIVIGAFVTACLYFLVNLARKRNLHITWWQWVLTALGFIYAIFVLELIIVFLSEGSTKGALVMGLLSGFIAIVWGILLGRFVFFRSTKGKA